MQYGHGNSKYVVISDPLATGHVTHMAYTVNLLSFNMG